MVEWGSGVGAADRVRGSRLPVAGCGGFVCVLGVVMFPEGVRREGGREGELMSR